MKIHERENLLKKNSRKGSQEKERRGIEENWWSQEKHQGTR